MKLCRSIAVCLGALLFLVSLRKRFGVGQSKFIEVRADVFNVFNTLNLNNPDTRTDNAGYGTMTSARIPRQSQFSLRFQF